MDSYDDDDNIDADADYNVMMMMMTMAVVNTTYRAHWVVKFCLAPL